MKKIILILTMIFSTAFVFATSFKVESVDGKVTYQSAPNEWKTLENGQELSSSSVIQTSINSTLVVSENGSKYTIKAMQKGSIENLIELSTKGGIKKGTIVKNSAVKSDTNKTSKSVVTASSRASEAKEDFEWEE